MAGIRHLHLFSKISKREQLIKNTSKTNVQCIQFVFDRELVSAYQVIITIAVVVRNFSYHLLFFNISSWAVHKLCRLGRGRGGSKIANFT